MLNRGLRRLTVSIDEIRTHNKELADGLLDTPFDFSLAFDRALKNIVNTLGNRPAHEIAEETVYYCAYIGSFGEFACNPRTLASSHLNHMVSLEGIVTKCSLVRPKVVKSVHYNVYTLDNLGPHERAFRDNTLKRNHVIKMRRCQCSWVASEFSKATDVRAVVYCFLGCFVGRSVAECVDNVLESSVESKRKVKRGI